MALYNTQSPITREERNNINATWQDILNRFSNLQRQINILAGDNDVDELIQRITDTVNNADATLTDLQTALSDATQLIDDMITATTSATDAANAANQATADATQLISDMTALQGDLEQLQTSLEQGITDATQATTDAINATTNANQATQDAQQATTNADNAANRANDAAYAIEGWGQVVPYQNGTTYSRNNPVTYQGSTYQSLIDDNDSLPTDDTKWIVMARRGLDGQGAVQTVNEQLPDQNGNVDVGIANINGLQGALDAMASDTDLIALDNKVTTHLDKIRKLSLHVIDFFRQPKMSKELFKLPTGVNEFCLCYEEGYYHLFYDNKTQTKYRRATTIEGLKNVNDLLTFTGRYPWALYDGDVWHLWVWNPTNLMTEHYTSTKPEGTYSFRDNCLYGKADWKVSKNPVDDKYYASYKDLSSFAGIAVSDSLSGVWTDLGFVFTSDERALWHSIEEADASIIFVGNVSYLLFAGWDGFKQRIGIVELDSKSFKVKNHPLVIVNPDESWHTVNGMSKVFSPVFLEEDFRIYYAQNPSAAVEAGWGYIESSKPKLIDNNKGIIILDSSSGLNLASNIKLNMMGSPLLSGNGVTLSSMPSGLGGSTGFGRIDNFTLTIEFEITTLPNGYAKIFTAIESEGAASGAVVGLWLSNSNLYFEIKGSTIELNISATSTVSLTTGRHYRVTLRKYGEEVRLIINGVTDVLTSHTESIGNLKYCEIGVRKVGETYSQQFIGTINELCMVAESLPLSML